jgi:uncharacterized membrane protein YkvA (DUF1232 family)
MNCKEWKKEYSAVYTQVDLRKSFIKYLNIKKTTVEKRETESNMSKLTDRAKKLKTDIPAVFLALKEKRTPWYAKIIAAVVVIYALSPIDLIPDFIPVLGYLDDLVILPALIALCIKYIPKDIFDDCRKRAEGLWGNGKPEKWYYAIPFILIWVAVIALIVIAFI